MARTVKVAIAGLGPVGQAVARAVLQTPGLKLVAASDPSPLHAGRDAMLGMALILQLLASRNVTLAGAVAGYPALVITKEKVALRGEFAPGRISDALRLHNPVTLDTQDGVKAIFADGWMHLRVSNTEGIVRVIAEGPDTHRAAVLQKIARDALDASW